MYVNLGVRMCNASVDIIRMCITSSLVTLPHHEEALASEDGLSYSNQRIQIRSEALPSDCVTRTDSTDVNSFSNLRGQTDSNSSIRMDLFYRIRT